MKRVEKGRKKSLGVEFDMKCGESENNGQSYMGRERTGKKLLALYILSIRSIIIIICTISAVFIVLLIVVRRNIYLPRRFWCIFSAFLSSNASVSEIRHRRRSKRIRNRPRIARNTCAETNSFVSRSALTLTHKEKIIA